MHKEERSIKPCQTGLQTKAELVTYKYPQGDGTHEQKDKGQILQMSESLDLSLIKKFW